MDLDSGLFVSSESSSGKQKWYGSGLGFGKHQLRPRPSGEEEDEEEEEGVASKLAKTNSFYEGPHMLCFSSPNHQFSPVNSGYGYGGLSGGNRGGGLIFTPSQWMELEHQALIYKYLTANVPVPPYLINPIRKAAFESAAFSAYSGLLHRPNSLGWGGFQVGFSNPNDAEPGRCRRTDGKKWRCSRDAVPDQKYCERHLNRGRHRSRKPVEGGQTGHSATAAVARGGNVPGNAVSLESQNVNLKPFFATRPSPPPPSQRSLHQFIDDWPKNRPDAAEPNSDRTRLSISIPVADFKSSTSSPASGGNLAASPLKLSWEHNTTAAATATQMGLGVGSWNPMAAWDKSASVGGPLGEVFHSTSSRAAIDGGGKDNDTWALNLMEGWGDVSPRISSSPTGVLQTAALCSLSNSSTGSSPRAAVNGDGNRGPSLCSLHTL
ncbi:unnamed protein product [Cuscuta campestris]|uniref:Growth-regulating factor n=1 Tax=Cuscuta campestris TaxID=132261 RepID=A0A484LFN5_9ASTE|nr:unnamed protein product [Cuscuta campestris]